MTLEQINAEIDALIPQLDAAKTDAERAPILKKIEGLEREKDKINKARTGDFVKSVDQSVAALDRERTSQSTDAVSALGRAARRADDRIRGGSGDGGGE